MRRARRGRKTSKHISISATDADWEDRSPQRGPARPVDRALPCRAGGTGRFGRGRRSCAGARGGRAAGAAGGGAGGSRADAGGGGSGSPGTRHVGADRGAVRRLGVCDGRVGPARKSCMRRSPRCWARSGPASPRPRSCPRPRSGRTLRRPAKGRWTPARTGCCEAGAISAADLGEVQEVVHTMGGVA